MSDERHEVVPLQRTHIVACAEIVEQTALFERYAYDGRAAAEQLVGALNDRSADVAVALDVATGQPIGYAWVARQAAFARTAYLRLIAVAPAYARKGMGRALMSYVERRNLLPAGLMLLATDDNEVAHRFYESLGYRHVGTLDDYVVRGLAERIYFKPPL